MITPVPVTFLPAHVTVWVSPGTTVLEASRRAGVVISAPCGGRGVCGSCGVRVVTGSLTAPDPEELRGLAHAPENVRLACRARIDGPVEIRPIIAQQPSAPSVVGESVSLVAGVDLGTTSVAAVLVDSRSGREIARATVPNRQQSFGADVLTRMSAALEGEAAELRSMAEASIALVLTCAANAGGVSLVGVHRVVVAGNTAMAALLLGQDVSSLATYPFTPPARVGDAELTSSVRSLLAPQAEVLVLPALAGFVGGDALAASIAAGLSDSKEPLLLVDLGTNAEVVLACQGALTVASAAAGPAFEGAGISCGGPAAPGAIESVSIADDGTVLLRTVGDGAPRWFSGSGLVSAIAQLRVAGHVDASGLLHTEGPLESRFETVDGVLTVRLGDEDGCVTLTQLDVRAFQLAKAAVQVGVESVLRAAHISAAELTQLLVAGAFGSALGADDLVSLGVLPKVSAGCVRLIGNAALEGAAVVALDPRMGEVAKRMVATVSHVDLAGDSGFAADLMTATELAPY